MIFLLFESKEITFGWKRGIEGAISAQQSQLDEVTSEMINRRDYSRADKFVERNFRREKWILVILLGIVLVALLLI
jgi:hypothetical protein